MRIAVITTVAGRHEHLRVQRQWLVESSVRCDRHVVVSLGDSAVADVVTGEPVAEVCAVPLAADGRLPVAAGRNEGARLAVQSGAQLLVFLDVDCIASPHLLERYRRGAQVLPDALLSGPVAYLPPPPAGGYGPADLERAAPHPARPVPEGEALVPGADPALFWSLSFAVTAQTWVRIGGFCEHYVGYGGEDTDFAQLAASQGVDHAWVGGAWAYHQHHDTEDPPVQHVADIVRNANLFHERWGWWPMRGWLDAFAERGLARFEDGNWVGESTPVRSPERSAPAVSGS